MILFLYADSLNYSMTPRVVHDELLQRSNDELNVVDIGRSDAKFIADCIAKADLIVFDNSIILAMNSSLLPSINFYLLSSRPADFYREVWQLVDNSDKPVFLFSPMSDLHVINFGLERTLYLDMLKRFSGIFWQFYKCPVQTGSGVDRYPYKTLEKFNLTKQDVVNAYNEITSGISINIDLPNSISPKELIQQSRPKKWDIIVPGAGYITRKMAQESVKNNNLKLAPYKKYYRLYINIPFHFYRRVTSKEKTSRIYQENSLRLYKRLINQSRSAFVCGSELRYNVRKYWEVPAWRTTMLAYPTLSLQDYGFLENVHYLQTFPEEAGEKAAYLARNPNFADKLADAAFQLVKTEHCVSNRVDQVIACLNSFLRGKLRSACYVEGKFEIIS